MSLWATNRDIIRRFIFICIRVPIKFSLNSCKSLMIYDLQSERTGVRAGGWKAFSTFPLWPNAFALKSAPRQLLFKLQMVRVFLGTDVLHLSYHGFSPLQ